MHQVLTFFGTWTFNPVVAIGLIVSAAVYFWGVRRVNHSSHGWPRRYSACFYSGLAITWFVVLGPVGAYDDVFFWSHMIQHLTLMMVAGPLLLLGAPVLLLLRVSSRHVRHEYVVPVLRSRLVAALTHPVVSWLLFAGVLVGTHFSSFYNYALQHPMIHDYVEHPLYLGVALIYYYPLLSPNPVPNRLPYALRAGSLALMMVPEAMSGFFIYASAYVRYPYYLTVHRPFGPGPLKDQQLGGALMWAGSMIVDSVWVAMAVHEWLRSEERRAHRLDLQTLAESTLPVRQQE